MSAAPWLQQEDRGPELYGRCAVTLALPCFAGHFPDAPILPGIVQLQWAVELAEALAPQRYGTAAFLGLARVKFKRPVQPPAELEFELRTAPGTITVRVHSAAGLHTEGRLRYRA
ncbi:MAG: hypothetical protein AAGI15_10905 [Pseudomonadota bacterium]